MLSCNPLLLLLSTEWSIAHHYISRHHDELLDLFEHSTLLGHTADGQLCLMAKTQAYPPLWHRGVVNGLFVSCYKWCSVLSASSAISRFKSAVVLIRVGNCIDVVGRKTPNNSSHKDVWCWVLGCWELGSSMLMVPPIDYPIMTPTCVLTDIPQQWINPIFCFCCCLS